MDDNQGRPTSNVDADARDLFVSGEGGCHTYRIPALIVTGSGTVLAFCEGRRAAGGDAGHIDLLVRRSGDCGSTWSETAVVASDPPHTVGNPCPVVDRNTGRIHLLFCKNLGDGPETIICTGKAPRTVWATYSDDDGLSWAEPREITSQAKKPDWTWYATGPCHGLQLTSGRLIIPCDHIRAVHYDRARDPHHSHVIYSDDGGENWAIGGILPVGSNESTAVETADGTLYINCRDQAKRGYRIVGWSRDEGVSFEDARQDEQLVDPVCQGSALCVPSEDGTLSNTVLFINPAGEGRTNLTLRTSKDGGRTWDEGKVLCKGPSAYSDLCALPDGRIGVIYECGENRPYERLRWIAVDVESLTQ